mgnify:CR=1 FL=1
MPGTILQAYGASAQTFTISLDAIQNTATWYSTAIVNSGATLYLDALVTASCYVATNPSSDRTVNFYAYGSVDGGTTFTAGVTATAGRLTTDGVKNARFIGGLDMTGANSRRGGPWSVAAAFGGVLPEVWGIIAENRTGTFLYTDGNEAFWQGIFAQYT